MLEQLQAVLAIVLIDLALSGDNALVIGMAARELPRGQRRRAVIFGGAGAVALRVTAAVAATLLLAIPYLQLVAGLLLVAIAYRLVRPTIEDARHVRPATSLREAIGIIVVADAAMSVENILGVAGAAHGAIGLLIFGLALSIPIVLFGSGLIVALLDRFAWAIWIGVGALVWTALELILGDPLLRTADLPWIFELTLGAAVLGGIALVRLLHARGLAQRPPPGSPRETLKADTM